jgi:hypothetical protein
MAGLSAIAALLNLLITVLFYLLPAQMKLLNLSAAPPDLAARVTTLVPLPDRLAALGYALVPAAIASFGLFALARLFWLCSQGLVFSPGAMRAFRQVAASLLANVVAAIATQLPISFLLTLANPPGHRVLSLGFGAGDFTVLFLAGAVFVISLVMAEAQRIADEHARFV